MAVRQEEHARELGRRLDDLAGQASAWRSAMGDHQLDWSPGEGAWSIHQVFEHLVTANLDYLPPLERLVEEASDRRGTGLTWAPTVAGNLLIRSNASSRKLPAPRGWRPGPAARPAVIEAFLETMARTRRLIEASVSLPWNRLRFGSPLFRPIRMNLGDGFTVIAGHAERHFRQVERIRAAPGFPA